MPASEKGDQSFKLIDVAKVLSFSVVLEALVCVLGSLSLTRIHNIWYVFVGSLFTKFGLWMLIEKKSWWAHSMHLFFLSIMAPWSILLPFISTLFVDECEHKLEEKNFHTMFAVVHNVFNASLPITGFSQYVIHCPKTDYVTQVPGVIEAGIPFLTNYALFKIQKHFWGIDMTSRGENDLMRNRVRRLVLDIIDITMLCAISFSETGLVFFQGNPVWFWVLRGVTILAFLETLAKAYFMFNFNPEQSNSVPTESERVPAVVSLAVLTLPTFCLRGYMYYVGVEISTILLAKGAACMAHEVAVVYWGNASNRVSTVIYRLIEQLPQIEGVDEAADEELEKGTAASVPLVSAS